MAYVTQRHAAADFLVFCEGRKRSSSVESGKEPVSYPAPCRDSEAGLISGFADDFGGDLHAPGTPWFGVLPAGDALSFPPGARS